MNIGGNSSLAGKIHSHLYFELLDVCLDLHVRCLEKSSKHILFNGGEQMVMNPMVESVKSPTKPKEVRVDQLGNNGT